ncbi:MAG: hypothetical protein RL071_686 [Pseudomonadota bacterium]
MNPLHVALRWMAPLLALLLLAALGLLGAPAAAQEAFATVARITEPDDRGAFRVVAQATRASRTRAGVEEPLRVGMALAPGDQVRAELARVELRLATGERLHLSEGSSLVLGERGVLDQLGEVYYRLRGAFRVEYGVVDTVVEGTRFVVRGPAPGEAGVTVRVDEGAVRVRNDTAEVALGRGQALTMPDVGAPLAPPSRSRPGWEELSRTHARGAPRLLLAGMTGGEVGATLPALPAEEAPPAQGALRLSAAVGLGPHLRVGGGAGLGLGEGAVRAPVEAFASGSWRGLTVGAGPTATWAQRDCACGWTRALHLGGAAWARGSLPLGRQLRLAAELRVGVADALAVGAAGGVEWAL